MAEAKPKGGRPKSVAEFHEGPESASRFLSAVKTVLGVSKERIVELERRSKKSVKRA
jgi:hypothetical protein